eukprot:TRINITY_DN7309_c1_g1_i1.p1 TRINITY_DN7309_c1_g1~~TRINITY_DN7309_c1_g1_i1.p1  ORF type:complete len:202 (-),score=77.20 TRINITY_DN7309_c1_g1_i1:97-702(-)
MIILFSEDQKKQLELLNKFKEDLIDVVIEYAIECIKSGYTLTSLKQLAEKVKIENLDALEKIIEALVFLFEDAAKYFIPEIDFLDSILTLGFSEKLKNALKDAYLQNREVIRKIGKSISVELPNYKNLDWRLDVEISSRSLRGQVTPIYLLKMELEDSNDNVQSNLLQTDVVNLKHIVSELENALSESKTGYARRLMRNVK